MIAIVALLLAVAQAGAGDPDIGGQLAQRSCTSCHVIAGVGHGAAPALPPADRGQGWLRAWLTNPHPPMRNLHLSEQEVEDIVAYLQTLPRT